MISANYTSRFEAGSITAYTNANDTWQLPYGIFAMGLGTALLPTLSEKLALGDMKTFKSILSKALKTVLLLTIPSAVAFVILREPVMSSIFKWSAKLTRDDISLRGMILIFFTISLLSQSLLAIINRAFYASNDTRTPLYFGATSILLNAFMCYIFFKTTNLQVSGMALAYSLASTYNAVGLIIVLNKRMKGIYLRELFYTVIKIFSASVIMGIVLYIINLIIPVDFSSSFTLSGKIIELMVISIEIAIGLLVYFAIIIKMKIDEAVYVYNSSILKIKSLINKVLNK